MGSNDAQTEQKPLLATESEEKDVNRSKKRQPKPTIVYDFLMWLSLIVTDIFFREVKFTGTFNIPVSGPAIIVIAPHANQFLDGALTMLALKKAVNRPLHFVEAATSLKRQIVGKLSRMSGAIPVERPQDLLRPGPGTITFSNYETDPCLLVGTGTQFTKDCEVKGLIGLPHSAGSSKIQEVVSDTEIRISKPFKTGIAVDMIKSGTPYKVAPKVDNGHVFNAVFAQLHRGGVVGISPEGGSHDRTDLLPLKPGVAIMGLGAVAEDPTYPIKIVPCGMNYFHPHKFRSRAVLEFGTPIVLTAEDGAKYRENPRDTVSALLKTLTDAMKTVTVTCPDYETLMIIQAARRLYDFPIKPVPLGAVLDMNRRLIIGYTRYQDDPRIMHLKDSVLRYNAKLEQLGIRDHQVEIARVGKPRVFFRLLQRVASLAIMATLSLPGTLLFSPVFIAAKVISAKKQRDALANSTVKIKANDVLGSWKVLVAMVVAPLLYFTYSLLGTILLRRYEIVPVVSKLHPLVIFCLIWAVLVSTTFAAFWIGEVGMDIFKSIRPLFSALGPNQNMLQEVQEERRRLTMEVTGVCNDLGPKVFPDFNRVIQKSIHKGLDEEEEEREDTAKSVSMRSQSSSSLNSIVSTGPSSIASVGPLENLGDIQIFSDTPARTRRPSADVSNWIEQAVISKNREKLKEL
ncbi:unnamed protein product [Kuraishia capsulata CBS 1993]|uniref:Phospholipid/glycerol acyltransferase domain-containing protein n=1 Tax=Kuraishia capsulata CBS 1993 TaxID=1382522 RepID=W6MGV3_9ASCO|nr:uncharacterized protein KUCA_T00001073001 [Kuraishia capsulata CBS 1993]CDK25106.1 unnamed protein product [Kuraishia capsulata CBS 1993]